MKNILLACLALVALLGVAGAKGADDLGARDTGIRQATPASLAPAASETRRSPASLAPLAAGNTARPGEGPSVIEVKQSPLVESDFRPFGEIIEVPAGTPPSVENAVMKYWGGLARARFHEEIEFGVIRVKARDRELAEMERHVKSPVFLVALDCDFLFPVAPYSVSKGGKVHPDVAKLKVFMVRKGSAVLLRRGAWHTLPFPVTGEGLFIEAARDGTWKKDTVLRPFRGKETVKF